MTAQTMDDIAKDLGDQLIPIKHGMTVKGNVVSVSRSRIIVDLQGIALGLIPVREFSSTAQDFKPGEEVSAYVMIQENDDGYVILSLRRADRERHLITLEESYNSKQPVLVRVKDVNRGGLVVQHGNIEGFLPISQLASQHYPRGGRDRVQDGLKGLVGKEMSAKIITFEPKANKIIFSEKAAGDSMAEERARALNIGEELTGTVSGVVEFGIFVNLGDIEGLVHISEISCDRVQDLDRLYKMGDEVKVQVISVEGGRVSLSIKRLTPDPWQQAITTFKAGQAVDGRVVRLSTFGAFIEIGKEIVGLMHVSEFGASSQEELEQKVKVGDNDQFQILSIDKDSRKVALAYPDDRRPDSAKKAAEARQRERAERKSAKTDESVVVEAPTSDSASE